VSAGLRHNNLFFSQCFMILQSYCAVLGGSLMSPTSAELQLTSEGAVRRSKGKLMLNTALTCYDKLVFTFRLFNWIT